MLPSPSGRFVCFFIYVKLFCKRAADVTRLLRRVCVQHVDRSNLLHHEHQIKRLFGIKL